MFLYMQDEVEPVLALQGLLHTLYGQAGYDLCSNYSSNYSTDTVLPLLPPDVVWADELLRQRGLRQ